MPFYIPPKPARHNVGGSDKQRHDSENEKRFKWLLSQKFPNWKIESYGSLFHFIDFHAVCDDFEAALEFRSRGKPYSTMLLTYGKAVSLFLSPMENIKTGRNITRAFYAWGCPDETLLLELNPEKKEVWEWFKKNAPVYAKDAKGTKGKFAQKDAQGRTETAWYVPVSLMTSIEHNEDYPTPWAGSETCYAESWESIAENWELLF